MTMIRKFAKTALFLIFAVPSWPAFGAAPEPHRLLPDDTIAFFTVPDLAGAKSRSNQAWFIRLWQDPSLKAFKDKFAVKFQEDVLNKLEREHEIEWEQYKKLLQGQATVAVLKGDWNGQPGSLPSWVAILDAGEHQDILRDAINSMKSRWVNDGRTLARTSIRDIEFLQPGPASKSGDEPAAPGYLIGQSGSLLLAGDSSKAIERLLILQSGGSIPSLAQTENFNRDYQEWFREALTYGWLNFDAVQTVLLSYAKSMTSAQTAQNPNMPQPEKVFDAIGLDGLKSVGFSGRESLKGSSYNMHFGVPEAERKGLFGILSTQGKSAAPPPFIGDEALNYFRWRLDVKKAWASLETMVGEVAPQMLGLLQLSLSVLGKDKDPNFDFRKDFIGNLGDDIVNWQLKPKGSSFAELQSPPTMYLLGSPNPNRLLSSIKLLLDSTMPDAPLKTREFLGRTIYTLEFPPAPNPAGGDPIQSSLSLSGYGGYVAASTDAAALESFLRDQSPDGAPLRIRPGIEDAAATIEGMETGFFGYQNDRAMYREVFNSIRDNRSAIEGMLKMVPMGGEGETGDQIIREWADLSLLPDFDAIEKYFSFTVYSLVSDARGLHLKFFTPYPPELK